MTKLKKSTWVIIGEAVIIIALAVFLSNSIRTNSQFLSRNKGNVFSASMQDVGKQAVNYINDKLIRGNAKASLEKITEEDGVYKIKIKIGGNEYVSYVTKDGRFLFPQVVDLKPPAPKSFLKTEKPDVELFVMAFCPYGNQAEDLMMPVQKLLGNKANISIHYIVSKSSSVGGYRSLHGEQELHEDIRELCVEKYQRDKFWNFVDAINKKATAQNVDSKWEEIAKSVGVDVAKVKECQSKEGSALLKQEMALTNKSYPVQEPSRHQGRDKEKISGSPTLVINGMIYDGQRSSKAFEKAICSAFTNPPAECSQNVSEGSQEAPRGACK